MADYGSGEAKGQDGVAMPYKLSSGRRYLNGELVDPPQLGAWSKLDFFPELDHVDCVALFAG